jgi:regulator of ribonuclease activity A
MKIATADLMDRDDAEIQSCTVQFTQYGAKREFHGPIRTIQTLEDNALIKRLLASPGAGAVLVIDGAASLRTALMGDVIGALAVTNDWSGVILRGAVRDVQALSLLNLGIKALGSNPRKSSKNASGRVDISIAFGDVTFRPGDWVYSDADGIVISPRALHV